MALPPSLNCEEAIFSGFSFKNLINCQYVKKFFGAFSTIEFLVMKTNNVLKLFIFTLKTPTKEGIKVPFIPFP